VLGFIRLKFNWIGFLNIEIIIRITFDKRGYYLIVLFIELIKLGLSRELLQIWSLLKELSLKRYCI
jgi:hypothetical protein